MNKAFKKILERLEEEKNKDRSGVYSAIQCDALKFAYGSAKEIVQEVAEEYKGGWIPCSEDSTKLPKENEKVRVTVWHGQEKIGFRQYEKWFTYGSEGVEEATVLAWQPTEPYKI